MNKALIFLLLLFGSCTTQDNPLEEERKEAKLTKCADQIFKGNIAWINVVDSNTTGLDSYIADSGAYLYSDPDRFFSIIDLSNYFIWIERTMPEKIKVPVYRHRKLIRTLHHVSSSS